MVQLHPVPSLQKPTLSAQVARHLLDLIQQQGLRPGDLVPSEVQICKDLQVSRGSVREAYRTLAALGVLEIESGRRPRLKAINPHVLAQIFGYALKTAQVTRRRSSRRGGRSKCRARSSRPATSTTRSALLARLVGQMRAALGGRSRASHCSRHGDSHDARGSELNPSTAAASARCVRRSSSRCASTREPPYRSRS